ncbi:hypothetical protein, partial [Bacillus sp. S1-R1J2-FB]|uniref:hypothetical protein n=1 Tax=Bacillus sp. S1-R1J2-FB TaxID=1973494 RepID=UPI001C54F837
DIVTGHIGKLRCIAKALILVFTTFIWSSSVATTIQINGTICSVSVRMQLCIIQLEGNKAWKLNEDIGNI